VPTLEQAARADVFAAERAGLVSFAVIDTRGRLRCHQCWRRYVSASVVKAMLLVVYLQRLEGEGRPLTSSDRGVLAPMIRYSDNAAATAAFWRAGGDAALYRLARRAGMERFDVYGSWGSAQITAADQTRFFARLAALTPRRFRGYARSLLSSIVAWQSWGIPELSRPGWMTFFKGGWRGTPRGQLVHQVALLERDGASIALAILTDGNSSHGYGRETIRGVAANLLRAPRMPGKAWPSPLPEWFWAWGRWYLHRDEFKPRPFRSGASRPATAPRPVPVWTWARLEALVQAAARPSRKPWPAPLPKWFWPWARWYLHRDEVRNAPLRSPTTRPARAPRPIPDWAWERLRELLPR
jgi:Beta-lactamase enzyme family